MWQTRADRRVDVLDDKVDRQFDVKILGGCGAAKKGRAQKNFSRQWPHVTRARARAHSRSNTPRTTSTTHRTARARSYLKS